MEGSRLELESPIDDAISRIRFAPNSNNLLISSWDSSLRLYDVDGSEMRFEDSSEGALLDCCFRDESTALSASSDGCIRRYDLLARTQTIVGKHDDSVIYVEFSDQTGQVISYGLDKRLMLWDIRMGNKGASGSIMADAEVWSISVSSSHLLAAIGKKVEKYDLRNLASPLQSKNFPMNNQIRCLCLFPNGDGYAAGSIDGCVDVKYFNSSMTGYAFWCHPRTKDRSSHLVAVNDIKFSPSNETFVTGDNEGHAIIWNAKAKKQAFEFTRYPNSVASLSYNQNGQCLAVASCRTYQEANEIEDAPQVFIHNLDNLP